MYQLPSARCIKLSSVLNRGEPAVICSNQAHRGRRRIVSVNDHASRPARVILPIGAKRFVEDHGQGWRLRHRVRRAQRALERDLARFETGAPGGCDFLASPRGEYRRRSAWSWSCRPGWVWYVSRRRCGPEGLKRWAASGERQNSQLWHRPVCSGSCAAAGPGLRRPAPSRVGGDRGPARAARL
jgi:hypothetical protein